MGGLLDPNTVLQLLQAKRAREAALQEQRTARERQLAQTLLLQGVENGANVEKLAGLFGQNVLPAGFVSGVKEIARVKKAREKQEEARTALEAQGKQALQAPSAGAGLEQVLSQFRGIESGARQAGVDPARALGALSQGLVAQERKRIADQQQAGLERRREVSDSGRQEFVSNLAGLVALDPENPALRDAVEQAARAQFPDAANQIVRQVFAQAGLRAQTGVGDTQFERFVSLENPSRRALLRARKLEQDVNPTVTQRKGFSNKDLEEFAERDNASLEALELGLKAERILTLDPGSVGFGEVLRRSVQGAGELAAGFNRLFGGNSFENFQQMSLDRLADAQGKQAEELRGILTNPNADIVDFTATVIAFAQENALTGGRRFSINAVNQLRDQLKGSFLRPAANTRRIFREANNQILRRIQSRRATLRKLDRSAFDLLQLGSPIPQEATGEAKFTIDETGSLVPVGEQ